MIERPPADAARTAEPLQRAPGVSLGPEALATVLAVLIIAVITAALLIGGGSPGGIGARPSSSPGPSSSAAPTPVTAVSLADIAACLEINARLAGDRADLQAELDAASFDASAVNTIFRRANADVIAGIDVATRLRQRPPTADVGTELRATYSDLNDRLSEALGNSVQNRAAYKQAAIAVVALLARLDPLDALLVRIRNGATATPIPSPSASPAPSSPAPASPPPTPSTPPVSPPPSVPVPSGTTGNAVVNPGFEEGVAAPWELLLTPPAQATLSSDAAVHAGGAKSARIDITLAGDERASVAVRQGGLSIQAGAHYLATIAVRTAAPREIRVRIASAAGDTYGTRLYTVGPAWQTLVVDITSFATDPNGYLEIDLGRAAVTTWLDDATFGQVAPTS